MQLIQSQGGRKKRTIT